MENNCVGDACEKSSDLWKRETKVERQRLLRSKTTSRMQVASLMHMSGLLYVSKKKGKWLRKNGIHRYGDEEANHKTRGRRLEKSEDGYGLEYKEASETLAAEDRTGK
ncbi:hypothetical protein BC332_19401 [Capsicum chinense]|nr:hypothetical protein BC332_19401 [Capsicum chinense]